ncbi:TauD/TfdA family dioxygenase, partial [Burkholderia cepacia]|uniref:TauD/TfdA family dioxygenase n=1 Tax=Burkholderia cepacia TaxID=292 RepID=UPI0013F48272
RLFWGLGTHLGIGIAQNPAGDLLVHVRDQGLDFSNPEVRGYQTSARLEYHSDSSDIVALLCVRPAREGGVSTIVSAGAVRAEAHARRPDLADVLDGPWWWDRRQADLATSFFERRIFAESDGALVSYYGRAHIESATRG